MPVTMTTTCLLLSILAGGGRMSEQHRDALFNQHSSPLLLPLHRMAVHSLLPLHSLLSLHPLLSLGLVVACRTTTALNSIKPRPTTCCHWDFTRHVQVATSSSEGSECECVTGGNAMSVSTPQDGSLVAGLSCDHYKVPGWESPWSDVCVATSR